MKEHGSVGDNSNIAGGLGVADIAPVLRLTNLSMTFPGQRALDGVDLEVRGGEVHALVGQNGSGKSTLIKILAGYHVSDPGARVQLGGAEVDPKALVGAKRSGLGFVHQDLALVESLSALENIALGRGFERDRLGGIKWRSEARRVHRAIAALGAPFDVHVPVAKLSPAQRTVVAMARAVEELDAGGALLVLDEPTASLPVLEVGKLFDAIMRLKAKGIGVIYVSHRLQEVFEIADVVTVLRDGRRVATLPTEQLDHRRLVELITGRALEDLAVPSTERTAAPVLEVSKLAGGGVRNVSFTVTAGEILGVAGILGSGREHVASLLFGSERREGGDVCVGDTRVDAESPCSALAAGMTLVPADRAGAGVVMGQTIRENLTLPRLSNLMVWGRINRRAERRDAMTWMRRTHVRPSDPERPVGALSGGNQQKVVLGKALRLSPRVLVLDEPMQGVDIGAKVVIFRLLREAAESGVAIVYCSADADEIAKYCHRAIILRDGEIVTELSGDALSTQAVAQSSLAQGDDGSHRSTDDCDDAGRP